jgi:hypothetical protein
MTERVNLSPISMLKLTLLMDNVTDRLLPNPYPFVKRAPMIAKERTISELQKSDPQYLVPCHCTGWKATNRIIEIMPEKFIQASVGTSFEFSS